MEKIPLDVGDGVFPGDKVSADLTRGDSLEVEQRKPEEKSGDASYLREIWNILNVPAWQKLTPEELAFIRDPEVPPPDFSRNDPKEQLRACAEVLRQREEDWVMDSYLEPLPPTPYEVFYRAAVFADKGENDRVSDSKRFAPEEKVGQFVEYVANASEPLTISKQLEYLLQLNNGSLIDAAAIGMMASRLVARRLDTKAYPHIQVNEELRDKWHRNLPIFGDPEKPNDSLADNYYFWTSVYSTLRLGDTSFIFRTMDQLSARAMTIARRFFVNQPTKTSHKEAFRLGKDLANFFIRLSRIEGKTDTGVSADRRLGVEDLQGANPDIKVSLIAFVLEKIPPNGSVFIEDPQRIISRDLSRLDFVEYFSAVLPDKLVSSRVDWRDVFSRLRWRLPDIDICLEQGGVVIRRRTTVQEMFKEASDTPFELIKSKLAEISNQRGRGLAEGIIVLGMSDPDADTIIVRGREISKIAYSETLRTLMHNPDFRKEYFSDDEWNKFLDTLSACVVLSPRLVGEHTVFSEAYKRLPRSLVLPQDGVTPRINTELLVAIDNFDPIKSAKESVLVAFTEATLEQSWGKVHQKELQRLGEIDSAARNVAVFYLRQSALEIAESDINDPRRRGIRETLGGLIDMAEKGDQDAIEALRIIFEVGHDYQSHPVLSLLAVMHDPSLYGTARYLLEGVDEKEISDKLAIAYAKKLLKLADAKPRGIATHQKSLTDRLSCPSCYGYAGGLEVAGALQHRMGGNETLEVSAYDDNESVLEEYGRFTQSMKALAQEISLPQSGL